MGGITFSIPRQLICSIQEHFRYRNFIETGTYKGATSIWASSLFEEVFTIEVNPELSSQAVMNANGQSNIRFIHGDSSTELKIVSESLQGTSMYWLDGHWCGGVEKLTDECPLMDELNAIKINEQDIILIDDARFFMGIVPAPHNPEEWPRIDEVIRVLKLKYPNHQVIIEYDIIMCLPQTIFLTVQELFRHGRLPAPGRMIHDKATSEIKISKTILRKAILFLQKFTEKSKHIFKSTNFQNNSANTINPSIIETLTINTLVDVGASMGDFIAQMKNQRNNLIVHAFEPVSSVYNKLVNRFSADNHCTFYNFAIGEKDGEVQFYANDYTYSSSVLPMTSNHVEEFPYTKNVKVISREMRRLDSILDVSKLPKPLLVKIDVQGFELQVINGGEELISQADYVLVEVSFVELYQGQPLFDEINSRMNQLGLFNSGNVEQLISKSSGQILQADALYCRRKS